MTYTEILEKVIKKAKENGFAINEEQIHWGHILDKTNYYALVFRQDFAKALWGEEVPEPVVEDGIYSGTFDPNWEFHLKKMVLSDDVLEYLEKNV